MISKQKIAGFGDTFLAIKGFKTVIILSQF